MSILRIAKALIIRPDGDALVLRRSDYKERPELASTPDFPGGTIEINETERQGLIREIKEETSIDVSEEQPQLIWCESIPGEHGYRSVIRLFYVYYLEEDTEVKLSWEHEEYYWAPLNELMSTYNFRPSANKALEYAFQHKLL